jgi:CRISPR-associated protein Csb2
MPGLTIAWEYLTGRCVATDPASRQRAEWPPHPGRVFMAMAAAWFETGEDSAEGQALRWLETLGNPEMRLPATDAVFRRSVVNVYVPVNDSAGPSSALLQSAPITRSKQPRTFPSVWVGDAPSFLHWPHADPAEVERHRSALDQLCGKVTRIGHSSSLVRMWLVDGAKFTGETWVPDEGLAELQTRRVSEGTLDLLDRQFNRRGREQHQLLSDRIAELKAKKKATTGQGSQQRKADLDKQIAAAESELEKVDSRDPIRPKLGLWTGYRRKEAEPTPSAPHTDFDSDLLILTQVDGPRLPLASTLMVTQALRGAILAHLDSNIPEWVSGHKPNGEPLQNGNQHLAFIPLPFVGHEHADGHLLGVGLVFPRGVSRAERGRALSRFMIMEQGEPRDIPLTLGRLGVWTVRKRDWMEHRQALQPETWTAHPKGATTWATVTPVVLDRFPKCDPFKEREAWEAEVAGMIATSCERLGLPTPVEVAVGTTSWHRGSPRATVKRRPLRGHPEIAAREAALGDGFPPYLTKGGNGPRPQLHVILRFEKPVVGPILLCAGRFLGYGLCKPLWGGAYR